MPDVPTAKREIGTLIYGLSDLLNQLIKPRPLARALMIDTVRDLQLHARAASYALQQLLITDVIAGQNGPSNGPSEKIS